MAIYGVVPARSGSKGVRHKNIRFVGGKSLLKHASEVASNSSRLSKAFISTDSRLYEMLAFRYGLSSLGLRSAELATDKAKTIDVLKEFVNQLETICEDDLIVLLQPTSPIRNAELIDECIHRCLQNSETTVTVSAIDEPHPMKTLIKDNDGIRPLFDVEDLTTPRQSLPKCYQVTGAVYVIPVSAIKAGAIYTAQPNFVEQESFCNIDSLDDLVRARKMLEQK